MIFNLKRFDKTYLAFLFFLLLSVFLIFVWFKEGYLYGGGDVGLPIYNPSRIFHIAKYIWWEAVAPGFLAPHAVTSVSLSFILSSFQLLGLTPVAIQAILFLILLFLMGFGMYLLSLSILGEDKKIYAVVAGLFYLFNPYMMIQIWHRFTHTSIFFVAALPFLVLFWRFWIKEGKYWYLLIFLLINFLASYMFGTIAHVIPLWLLLFLLTVFEIIFPWKNKTNLIQLGFRFLLGLILWILTNSWWLIPTLTVTGGIVSQQHSIEESVFTFVNISRQAIVLFSLQLVNSFYIFYSAEFGESYKNIFFRLLPWVGVSFTIFGLIMVLARKYIASYAVIFIIILFLAKGASSPFGHPFLFSFDKFFALGLLRNPFEKIGILLPLLSGILFALGTEEFVNWLKKYIGTAKATLMLIVILIILGIYYWPMFQGKIFGTINKQAFVDIPPSYREADKWLSERVNQNPQGKDGKILHLPLTRSDVATYKWRYGYHGVESSAVLFNALPSISRGFNLKRIDDSLGALSLIFHKPNSFYQEQILKILQDFNVRFIILHKDIEWRGSDIYDPSETETVLKNLKFLEKKATFDNLTIYEVNRNYFKPKIFMTDKISLVYPADEGKFWPWMIDSENTFITPMEQEADEETLNLAKQILIFPTSSFNYPESSSSAMSSIIDQIIRNDDAAKLLTLPFTKIKPILVQNGELQSEKLNEKLILASEQIVKILRSQFLSRDSSSLLPLIENYHKLLKNIFTANLKNSRLLLYINKGDTNLTFQFHLNALAGLANKADPNTRNEISKVHDFLKDQLIKNDFIPQTSPNLGTDQKIFKFQIPKNLNYEILMTDTAGNDIFPGKLSKIQLSMNGEMITLAGQNRENIISYNKSNLEEGPLEIGYTTIYSPNLAQPFDQMEKSGQVNMVGDAIEIKPQGSFGHIGSLIPQTKGGDIYRVSFEAMAKEGNGFYFQVVQDTDGFDENNQRISQWNQFINLSKQNDWQTFNFMLPPLRIATQQAAIRFVVASNQQTLTPPVILIRNLRVEKILNNNLVLRGELLKSKDSDSNSQVLDTNKNNPVLYRGKIKAKKRSFLVFSETYHPGWKLTLINNEGTYTPQKHFLANLYANGWLIEKAGEYDFKLEFEPQRMVNYGAIIASLSFASLIFIVIWRHIRKE